MKICDIFHATSASCLLSCHNMKHYKFIATLSHKAFDSKCHQNLWQMIAALASRLSARKVKLLLRAIVVSTSVRHKIMKYFSTRRYKFSSWCHMLTRIATIKFSTNSYSRQKSRYWWLILCNEMLINEPSVIEKCGRCDIFNSIMFLNHKTEFKWSIVFIIELHALQSLNQQINQNLMIVVVVVVLRHVNKLSWSQLPHLRQFQVQEQKLCKTRENELKFRGTKSNFLVDPVGDLFIHSPLWILN